MRLFCAVWKWNRDGTSLIVVGSPVLGGVHSSVAQRRASHVHARFTALSTAAGQGR